MDIEDVKDCYILCNIDPNFAVGRRANLRYACEYVYASLIELNPGGLEPFDYLNFAKSDISAKDIRGAINALGNAKKAIHLTVDCFFEMLGLLKAFRKSDFPTKLDIIQQLEAFPTNVTKNLNSKRNYVEHEYKTIDISEAIDLVDITEMFSRLCYPFLKHMIIGIHVGLKGNSKDISWVLNPYESQICIYENLNSKSFNSPVGIIYYDFSKDENDRTLLEAINIRDSNLDDWLPYLNTLVYCTKRAIIPENPPYDPAHYKRLMVFERLQMFSQELEDESLT
jgi:hypothetical protein